MSKRIYKWKPLPKKLRKKVLERDSFSCRVCGRGRTNSHRRLAVHHRRGHRTLRADAPENLLVLCASCHSLVGLLAQHCKAVRGSALAFAIQLADEHWNAVYGGK